MKKRIIGLDLLRVIGVVFIFLYHFTVEYIITGGIDYTDIVGYNYVFNVMARPASLFLFIISGYALMYNHEDEISLKKYYGKRIKGLYIPFYVAYLLMAEVFFLVNNQMQFKFIPTSRFVYTIIGFDGVMFQSEPNFYLIGEWFMSCIVVCYLVFPLLALLLKKFRYLTLVVLLAVYITLLFFYYPFKVNVFMNPLLILLYFYIGMLMYKLIGDKIIPVWFRYVCLGITVILWIYYLLVGFKPGFLPFELTDKAGEILFAFWSIIMILGLRDVEIAPEKALYKVVAYISKISWYIILVHHGFMTLYFMHKDASEYNHKEMLLLLIFFIAVSWTAAVLVMKVSNKINKVLFKPAKQS